MRRSKPKLQDTRLPRLRNALPLKRAEPPVHEKVNPESPAPRILRGKTFRLRDVHRD